LLKHLTALTGLALLGFAGCTSGNSAIEPAFGSANLNLNKAQLAVGVATLTDGSKGLNTVVTFRQPNGLSATLLNTPTIVGPANLVVPAIGAAGVDGGTNHISASPQVLPGQTAIATTFGTSGGAFAYGFSPENSSTAGSASFTLYTEPFFPSAAITARTYKCGPPACPQTRNGTFPTGFTGYTEGFSAFAQTTPVAGTYNLSVAITDVFNNTTTIAAPAATLTSTVGLPAFAAAPTFIKDGQGGLTINFTAPAGVTETLVNVVVSDATYGTAYYTLVAQGSGAQSAVLPPNLGPTGTGSGTTAATSPTIPAGDAFRILLVGADYPAYEAIPSQNAQQTPTIAGANGQADITLVNSGSNIY